MRLHRFLAALLLGLPMATPIPVAAEDAPLAPEVQRLFAWLLWSFGRVSR